MNFLTQEHFARAAEYAIYTVDVPCALGSAYLQFSVNSAFSHGVCRTQWMTDRMCAESCDGARDKAQASEDRIIGFY